MPGEGLTGSRRPSRSPPWPASCPPPAGGPPARSPCPGLSASPPSAPVPASAAMLPGEEAHGSGHSWSPREGLASPSSQAGDPELRPPDPLALALLPGAALPRAAPTPTSFLAQLASHSCRSTASWSFRAFSSICRQMAVSKPHSPPCGPPGRRAGRAWHTWCCCSCPSLPFSNSALRARLSAEQLSSSRSLSSSSSARCLQAGEMSAPGLARGAGCPLARASRRHLAACWPSRSFSSATSL